MQTLERFCFQGKTAVKFKTLQFSKILDINTNRIFLIPFKFMYKSLGYTQFENPFRSKQIRLIRWDKQKISLTNAFVLFFYMEGISLKYNNGNNNILLSKFTLKYLVCCQLFWVEVGGSIKPRHIYMDFGVLLLEKFLLL